MSTEDFSRGKTILTVSQVTQSIRKLLEKEYRFVRICGEISNFKTVFSGHSYFQLKDSSSQIRAVLFKQQKRFVDLELEDGQEVVCFGRITVYEPRGDYQLIVDSVELYGRGRLQLAFEKLKEKLAEKGYFDKETKKEIPQFPEKVALITSPTGAALQDYLKIVKIRKAPVQIQIMPVRVQGREAPTEIAEAIKKLNVYNKHDIIVLCRGGGSIEDLWAFNDITVAESIYKSRLPVVTGIGHEIDYTIADLCADFRCPTPTAAAEKLTIDGSITRKQLFSLKNRLVNQVQNQLLIYNQQIQYQQKVLDTFKTTFFNIEHRLDLSRSYFFNAIQDIIYKKELQLASLKQRLHTVAPTTQLLLKEHRLLHIRKELVSSILYIIEKKESHLLRQAALLNSVSPLATLERGYSITRKLDSADGKRQVVKRSKEVDIGENLEILLHEGSLSCKVTAKK